MTDEETSIVKANPPELRAVLLLAVLAPTLR